MGEYRCMARPSVAKLRGRAADPVTLDDRHRGCLDESVYREFRPDRRLRPFVECGWLRSGLGDSVDTGDARRLRGRVRERGRRRHDRRSGQHLLRHARWRPRRAGGSAITAGRRGRGDRVPGKRIHKHARPLDSAFGVAGHRMAETLFGATTPTQRMSLLAMCWPTISQQPSRWSTGRSRGRSRCCEHSRTRPVSALADEIGLSERQLRRRFEAAVGYGPKRLGRVFRFQRLLDLVHASHGRAVWSQLAIAAGYADQSHMINECLALTGGPPTALPGVR